ncbi:19225_t:CDS:2, partial [Funneliformis geosporum]
EALRNVRILTQALQDERHTRQRRDTEIDDLRRRKDAEIDDLRRYKDAEISSLRGIIMIQNAGEGGMVVPFVKLRIGKTDIRMKLWDIKNSMVYPKNWKGEFQGKADTEIGRIGAGVATGADIILNGIWGEDWSIAGGKPTNDTPVAPNAGGSLPAITIEPNITLSQHLYLLETAYTTIEHLKHTVDFGQLMQGDMGIKEFSA